MRSESNDNRSEEQDKLNKPGEQRLRWASSLFSNPLGGGTYFFIKVTAVILLLTVASYSIYYYNQARWRNAPDVIRVTSTSHTRKVNLSDGSQVWLKPGSKLKYPEKFSETGQRVVSVEGEAMFKIAKEEPERFFIVHARNLTATVTGTSFSINSKPDTTRVYVVKGKVLLTTTTQKMELDEREKVLYIKATHEFKKIEPGVSAEDDYS